MKKFAYFVMISNALLIPFSLYVGKFDIFQAFFNASICFLIATELYVAKIFDK